MKYQIIKFAAFVLISSLFTACVSTDTTGGKVKSSTASTQQSAKPGEIQIVKPLHESTVDSLHPSFEWTSAGDEVTYDFKLYKLTDDPKKPIELLALTGLTEPKIIPDVQLEPATDYGWSVRAISADGTESKWVLQVTRVFTGISFHQRKRLQKFTTPN